MDWVLVGPLLLMAILLWWNAVRQDWRRRADPSTLIDEYGDTGIVQPTATPEVRRNSRGQQLGPKALDPRSYDERQVAPQTDVSGRPMDAD